MSRLTVDRSTSFPRLLLDGAPLAVQAYLRSWEKYPGREGTTFADLCADYRRHYALGCRVFLFQATCASDFYVPEVEVWRGPGIWDFAQLDAFLAFFASDCPEAVVIPQLYIGAPPWWEEAHPDELVRFADGGCEADFAAASGSARRKVAAPASEAWAAAMDEGLARTVRRIAAHGPRIGGWLFGGGITYEWGLLGSFGMIDYSAPMVRWWHDWRAARGLPAAPPPTPEQRLAATGDWRDPARDALAIAWQRCLSDLTAARITRFAAVIRRHGGARPVITFYGFTLTAREGQGFIGRYGSGGFQGGHHAFRAVLDCPDIDAITSPWAYADRRLATGDLSAHYPWDSVRLAGKVSWIQDDNRTCLGFPAQGIDTGHEPDRAGTIRQMARACARRIAGADETYRMDLLGGSWNDPALEDAIRRLDRAALAGAAFRRAPRAEVLVVVDEDAVACLALHSPLHLQNVYRQLPALARMGCPYHIVLADDALALDPRAYRLLVLALCPRRDARLDALVARFRDGGSSVLCLPGTALVGDHGPDPRGAEAVANLPLTCRGAQPTVLLGRLPAGGTVGLGRALSHACHASAGECLLPLADGGGAALALVARATGGFDAWAAVAPLPPALLATLAARAGCHLVHPGGEWVYATPALLAICAAVDGQQRLTPATVFTAAIPLVAPRAWHRDGGSLVVDLVAGEVAVFALEGVPA